VVGGGAEVSGGGMEARTIAGKARRRLENFIVRSDLGETLGR
jgi:hypothetical protein